MWALVSCLNPCAGLGPEFCFCFCSRGCEFVELFGRGFQGVVMSLVVLTSVLLLAVSLSFVSVRVVGCLLWLVLPFCAWSRVAS